MQRIARGLSDIFQTHRRQLFTHLIHIKAELASAYSGAFNAGRPLLLEGGLKWQPLSLSPADMDFATLKAAAVPTEAHLFQEGGHGFGVRLIQGRPAQVWPDLVRAWAARLDFAL